MRDEKDYQTIQKSSIYIKTSTLASCERCKPNQTLRSVSIDRDTIDAQINQLWQGMTLQELESSNTKKGLICDLIDVKTQARMCSIEVKTRFDDKQAHAFSLVYKLLLSHEHLDMGMIIIDMYLQKSLHFVGDVTSVVVEYIDAHWNLKFQKQCKCVRLTQHELEFIAEMHNSDVQKFLLQGNLDQVQKLLDRHHKWVLSFPHLHLLKLAVDGASPHLIALLLNNGFNLFSNSQSILHYPRHDSAGFRFLHEAIRLCHQPGIFEGIAESVKNIIINPQHSPYKDIAPMMDMLDPNYLSRSPKQYPPSNSSLKPIPRLLKRAILEVCDNILSQDGSNISEKIELIRECF